MIYLPIFAIAFTLIMFGYIIYELIKIDGYKTYKPTEEDLARERKVMTAEKRHFGRYQLYNERQSKEYKQWRKTLCL